MTTTDDLAARAADERKGRERRTAVAAAFREAARNGTATSSALERLVRSRIDGTQMTTREPEKAQPTQTNHNDHITSGLMPLETIREDF